MDDLQAHSFDHRETDLATMHVLLKNKNPSDFLLENQTVPNVLVLIKLTLIHLSDLVI